jgi:hypothetical protein
MLSTVLVTLVTDPGDIKIDTEFIPFRLFCAELHGKNKVFERNKNPLDVNKKLIKKLDNYFLICV